MLKNILTNWTWSRVPIIGVLVEEVKTNPFVTDRIKEPLLLRLRSKLKKPEKWRGAAVNTAKTNLFAMESIVADKLLWLILGGQR